jgi:hypothetical protein
MEVHHHTHTDPAHSGTSRKKFTHYLWEFLMLFLAVFCGFMAENFREHYVEHQRGKQYASTMIEDLKADKEALEAGIRVNKAIVRFIDTLLTLYLPDNTQTKTTAQLYYYGRYALRFWYYVNKQVTLEQMKHSGTIRYFQNSSLEKQMVSLDKMISFITYWDKRDELFHQQAINYSSRLFNYAFFKTIPVYTELLEKDENTTINPEWDQSRAVFLRTDPPLVNKQPELIAEFLNFCSLRVPVLKAKVSVYTDALLEIEKITVELRKEYHLPERTP